MVRKKRPQYVQDLVNKVNGNLRLLKVKDENDTLFWFMCDYLLKKGMMYEGYNFYKDKFNPYTNTIVPMLAGSCKKDEYEYLQIW